MMRQIILDTETTGLDPAQGHRVIEIGAVEILDRRITGATFHAYLNPDRDSDPGALQVHGLTREFLADKPRFAAIADDFIEFVRAAEVLIHNAPFDVGFLDAELARIDHAPLQQCCTVQDTLKLAKGLHPGQKNNLDALCKRYAIDHSGRALHGALLDAQLLADVYLAMTRGQENLAIDIAMPSRARGTAMTRRGPLRVLRAGKAELTRHADYLAGMTRDGADIRSW